MTASPIPNLIRKQVTARADGRCERCGLSSRLELHHRLFRSRGGAHTVANLTALCGFGNTSGCHGFAHSGADAAYEGWAVRSGMEGRELSRIPLLDARGFWWLLDDDGTKTCIPEGLAHEYLSLFGVLPGDLS